MKRLILLTLLCLVLVVPTISAWSNDSYSKCLNITVTNPTGSSQNNFTVGFNITYDADMQTDFDDIVFFTGSCSQTGVELKQELEFKTNSASAYAWVLIPNITTNTNIISMYYGNSTVSSNWDYSYLAWDSDYVLVMHLNDGNDSTWLNNGTLSGVSQTTFGRWGKAFNWSGKNTESINISNSVTLNTTTQNWSIEGWVYPFRYTVASPRIVSKESGTSAEPWALELTNSNNGVFCTLVDGATTESCSTSTINSVTTGKWSYVSGSYAHPGSGGKRNIYIDGSNNKTDGHAGNTAFNQSKSRNVTIGNNFAQSRQMNGTIDEVRISKVERSNAWFNLTYQLIANYDSLVVFSAEQSAPVTTTSVNYTYYVDCVSGSDSNNGTQSDAPFKTITKVNTLNFNVSDWVLFKRDQICRGQIVVKHNGHYGSYGIGDDAEIWGSYNLSHTDNWTVSYGNVYKSSSTFPDDVGNIALNIATTETYGFKKNMSQLASSQGQYYYNTSDSKVYFYSTSNPATFYPNGIEVMWDMDIIDNTVVPIQNITVINLTLRYSGGHAIGFQNVINNLIKDTKAYVIGGSYLDSGKYARYGNAFEWGLNSSNATGDGLWAQYVFDSCYTHQAWTSAGNATIKNVELKNSVCSDAAIGYEYFNSRVTGGSNSSNVSIHDNTFVNLNSDWHGNGRPDILDSTTFSYQTCLRLARNSPGSKNFTVYNNICAYPTNYTVEFGDGTTTNWDGTQFDSNYNLYYQNASAPFFSKWKNTRYATLALHQSATGNDSNSNFSDPLFTDYVNDDFTPIGSSSACGNGLGGTDIGALPCGNTTYYFNTTGGSDSNDCMSESTACQTITKQTTLTITPGDRIRFACGEEFSIVTSINGSVKRIFFQNGTVGNYVIYGNYGVCTDLNLPKITTSYKINGTDKWISRGSNIWEGNFSVGYDIGNLIFNYTQNELDIGYRWQYTANMSRAKDFVSNTSGTRKLYVYSTDNPGSAYQGGIELIYGYIAISPQDQHHEIFEGLHITKAGMHGFDTTNEETIIRNNQISNIGGGYCSGGCSGFSRWGNGIQLWYTAVNISVLNNKIWEVFDAALTTQTVSKTDDANLNHLYQGNVVMNSTYCFEYIQDNDGHMTNNTQFIHNTCINNGYSIFENQRNNATSQTSRPTCIRMFDGNLSYNLNISNNICWDSSNVLWLIQGSLVRWQSSHSADYNAYFKNTTSYVYTTNFAQNVSNGNYISNLGTWQTMLQKDNHSISLNVDGVSLFDDAFNVNYYLRNFTPFVNSTVCNNTFVDGYIGAFNCTALQNDISQINYSFNYTLNPSLTNLYDDLKPNFTKLVYVEANYHTGDYVWRLYETLISFNTSYVFNITANSTGERVYMNITPSSNIFNLTCNNVVIRSTPTNFVNLTANDNELINCTMDLNINQTYDGWSLTVDNANYSFVYSLQGN
jgi:hypothetical protein